MSSADVQGKFLWHALTTTDPSAAGAFYTRVLGWKARPWERDPSYTLLANAEGPVASVARLPADAQANGATASWLPYVAVTDVDMTAAAAQRLGGRVVSPAADLPDGGRHAVLADPQSGVFGICTWASTDAGAGASEDEFAWHELATADHSAAFHFYRELFGWEQLGVHDMGEMGPYLLFGRNGRQLGGMFNRPSSLSGGWPHWLVYARVTNAAKVAEAAADAGGRVVNGPHQVPGGSWIVQLADPQGAAIAVNQSEQAAAATAAPVRRRPAKAAHAAGHAAVAKPAEPAPPSRRKPEPAAAKPRRSASALASATAVDDVTKAVPARKSAGARKSPARKAPARKAAARKSAARKAAPRRVPAARRVKKTKGAKSPAVSRGKNAVKRSVKRAPAARSAAVRGRKKTPAKRPARKAARRKSARRGGR